MRLTTRYTTAGTAILGECFAHRRRCALREAPESTPCRPKVAPRGLSPCAFCSLTCAATMATLNASFMSSFTASTAFLLNCSLITPTAYRRASIEAVFSHARIARNRDASIAWPVADVAPPADSGPLIAPGAAVPVPAAVPKMWMMRRGILQHRRTALMGRAAPLLDDDASRDYASGVCVFSQQRRKRINVGDGLLTQEGRRGYIS